MMRPIIESRLDNDLYAFTMSQFARNHFRGVKVRYRFINRSDVPLGRYIDAERLAAEIERIRRTPLTPEELRYMLGLGLFDPAYLDWLKDAVLPEVRFSIVGDELFLEYEGEWLEMMIFETPLLAVISEITMEARIREAGFTLDEAWAESQRRLEGKINYLHAHPELHFMLFGARRRQSRAWEEHTHRELLAKAPRAVTGTANVDLARRFGIPVRGTKAHQTFMVPTALADAAGALDPIGTAQTQVLDLWEKEFGHYNDGQLLVPLTDTYGTPAFLARLEPEQAKRLRGFRQDSGDPVEIGRLIEEYLRENGIDPAAKRVYFTDGQTFEKATDVIRAFAGTGWDDFGIGGYIANDTVVPPVSMVVKPVAANGHPTVKLSDNLAKATGDPETVERMKRLAGYTATYSEAPVR